MVRLEEPVAQPVEHLTFNQGVKGSNPFGLTNQIGLRSPEAKSKSSIGNPVGNLSKAQRPERFSADHIRASTITAPAFLRARLYFMLSLPTM